MKKALTLFKENNINYKIFGNGSNIIPSDKIYDGVIIKLSSLNNLKIEDEVIEVEAGYSLMKLAKEVIKLGLSGLEWACGIPGTIGGAVYMNAGAYKQDMSFVLEKITVLDENMNIVTLNKDELDSYIENNNVNNNALFTFIGKFFDSSNNKLLYNLVFTAFVNTNSNYLNLDNCYGETLIINDGKLYKEGNTTT